jgi:hypothetical protein
VASKASWYEIDELAGEIARMRQQVDQMQQRLETLVDVKMRFEVDPSRNPPEIQGKSKKAKGKSEESAAAPREDLDAAPKPTAPPSRPKNQRRGGQQKTSAAAQAPDPVAVPPRTTHASTGGGKRTPSVMTPETQDAIIHYVEAGASLRQAAAMVKCNNSTITKFAQRNEEFANRLEMAEDAAEFRPRMRIVKASRQSWRAAAWLLRTHQPSDRQRRERSEQSDRETADSMNRLSRMLREGDPSADVDVKLENGKKKVVKTRDSRKEAAAEWERISGMARECGIECP